MFKITGKITPGFNNSSNWMPIYIPWLYPGTLNVLLDCKKPKIKWKNEIPTKFKRPIKISNCLINNIPSFVISPPDAGKNLFLLEIGHKENLRNKLNLNNNDIVEIILNLE